MADGPAALDFAKSADGLIAAIAQDADSGEVLMLAWMNEAAWEATQECGYAVYWSRSRGKLWRKGESSGNVQKIREILVDCDGDAVLLKVEQVGDAACHTGRRSCFSWQQTEDGLVAVCEPLISAEKLYSQK